MYQIKDEKNHSKTSITSRSFKVLWRSTLRWVALVLLALGGASPAFAGSANIVAVQEMRASYLPPHTPRFNRVRPVIAVVGYNASTELTDYVVPYGILAESGVADVTAVATGAGPVQMSPALRFEVQATTREFNARYPHGADYVIVPNVYKGANDPVLLDWVRDQAARGAIIVGICDGVPVLANAGLLRGRRATGHWNTIDDLERQHRDTRWLRNTRYIADGNVITTSGVSASIPISIALIEAIAGREHAARLAQTLGVTDWSPAHYSESFKLDAGSFSTALGNKLMFWRHEILGVTIAPGVDEIALALVVDAYGRTRRSEAVSVAASELPVSTRRGLMVVPDVQATRSQQPSRMLSLFESLPAVQTLDRALDDIAADYGQATADFVALTMEYPRPRQYQLNPLNNGGVP